MAPQAIQLRPELKGSRSDERSLKFRKAFRTPNSWRPDSSGGSACLSITMATAPSGLLCPPSPSGSGSLSGSGSCAFGWRLAAGFGRSRLRGCGSGWREAKGRGVARGRQPRQGSAQPWRAEGGPRWASSSSWAPALWSPPSCIPCTGRRPRSPRSSRSVPQPARPQPAMPPRGKGEPPDLPWAAPPSGKDPTEEPGPGRASPGPQEPGSEFGSRDNGFPSSFLPSSSRYSE